MIGKFMNIKAVYVVLGVIVTVYGCDNSNISGERLYNDYCSDCHGNDAKGASAPGIGNPNSDAIKNAIDNVPEMNQRLDLTSLTDEEINAISNYLLKLILIPRQATNLSLRGTAFTTQPIQAELVVKDSLGHTIAASINNSDGTFSVNVSEMTPPYVIQATSLQDNRVFYSYAQTPGVTNITPLTDLALRTAAGKDNIDALFPLCNTNISPCFNNLSEDKIAAANQSIKMDFSTEISSAGLNPEQFNAGTAPLDANHQQLLAQLENSRIHGCTNPINPNGYRYDDDTNGSCFHDTDYDYDGVRDGG
jgi:hypothetical protein